MGGVGKPPRTSNTVKDKTASDLLIQDYNFGHNDINYQGIYPSIPGHPVIGRRLTFVGCTLGMLVGDLLGAEVGPDDGTLEGTCRW